MCILVHENSIKVCEVHCILERREEHTTLANTHVEDLCVGVAALLNDMAKLTLSDADLTVLTAFVRKWLLANVCQILFTDTSIALIRAPSLSRTHAPSRVTTLPSPLAPTVYLQVDITHICALHTLP